MQTILIVDDDDSILEMVSRFLTKEGYLVETAHTASEALNALNRVAPDLFIVDVFLPGLTDGIGLCRKLRTYPQFNDTPIMFLTGQDNTNNAVAALNAGGDDYIRKPFAVRELAARVRAHLRRSQGFEMGEIPTIRFAPTLNKVLLNARPINLTRVEFDLLYHLCQIPDKWHTPRDLLAHVWQYPNGVGDTALVRNHIRNLRRKLEDNPDRPTIILSRHGRGYVVRARVGADVETA